MDEFTRKFNAAEDKEQQVHYVLTTVYESLKEKGYDPINQIVGYILSEDPTYITNHNSARSLICKIDRDELLQVLVKSYLGAVRIISHEGPPKGGPFYLTNISDRSRVDRSRQMCYNLVTKIWEVHHG